MLDAQQPARAMTPVARLAHVTCEFDYYYTGPPDLPAHDDDVRAQIKQLIIAGLWRGGLSNFPLVTVTLRPLETPSHG